MVGPRTLELAAPCKPESGPAVQLPQFHRSSPGARRATGGARRLPGAAGPLVHVGRVQQERAAHRLRRSAGHCGGAFPKGTG